MSNQDSYRQQFSLNGQSCAAAQPIAGPSSIPASAPHPAPPSFPSIGPLPPAAQTNIPGSYAPYGQQYTGNQPSAYDDPAKLLRVIPLANYAPTARVAGHLARHTVAYPTPPDTSSSSIFPPYAETFQRIDAPRTQQDWEMRQQAEQRLSQVLQSAGSLYGQQLGGYPAPPSLPFVPNHRAQPIPYSFMPSYPPPTDLPPTPTSLPEASDSPSGSHYNPFFERLVDDALSRGPAPPLPFPPRGSNTADQEDGSTAKKETNRAGTPNSITNTPTISRTISKALSKVELGQDSPDPLSLPGPSPSKRPKNGVNGAGNVSPTLVPATSIAKSSRKALPSSRSALPLTSDSNKSRPTLPAGWRSETSQEPPSPSNPGKSTIVVEIPTPRRSSISSVGSSRMQVDDEDESEDPLEWEDGEGDEEEARRQEADEDWAMDRPFRSPTPSAYGAHVAVAKHGSKSVRTGEKDLKTARQKFDALLEDIFEAADSLPADPTSEDLSQSKFLDRLARDGATPLLSREAVDRVSRYAFRIHSGRRARPAAAAEDKWDEESLKRLLRLLERVMREGEGEVPFVTDMKGVTHDKEKEKLKGKKKGRKGVKSSKSPEADSLSQDGKGGAEEEGVIEEVREKAERCLAVVSAASRAALCCLVILDGEDLSKPMYSEDLLSLVIGLIRDQMSKVIFPVVEGMAGEKMTSRYLASLVQSETAARQTKALKLSPFFIQLTLSSIAQCTAAALPHLSSLISRQHVALSDGLVIQAVYLAISPLFVSEPVSKKREGKNGVGKSGWGVMKSLRIEALGCLREAFARYSDQRQWIIEEILSSLVKLPDQKAQSEFQLTNGTKMSTITALLLQLIHASAYGASSKIRKIRSGATEVELGGKVGAKDEADANERRLCAEITESYFRSSSVVAAYLLRKSSQAKVSKSTLDTDFKTILETFINDLLKGLYRPEWPAAALYLSVFSKMFIAALEDQSSSAESTATKNIALDHLGTIGAKLKSVQVAPVDGSHLSSLDQIIGSEGVEGASASPLIDAHKTIHSHLALASREDSMFASARDLSLVTWASELHAAIDKKQSISEKLAVEKTEEAQATKQYLDDLGGTLRGALSKLFDGAEDVFAVDQPRQADAAIDLSTQISRHRPLQSAFEPILHAILAGMDMSAVALRSKALKALSLIAAADADVLSLPKVRQAFEGRLSDSSPAVRDAAVDLVGKYVVQKPELGVEYYPQIAQRVTDTGLAVRKKVIKLLKDIFPMAKSTQIRVDICCKMVEAVGDNDDNVKEMAVKALIELLYSSSNAVAASLFVDIVQQFRNLTAPLEKALDAISAVDASTQAGRTKAIVDALVQRLVDETESAEFDAVSHIRAISLLCGSKADLIDPHKAGVLLNYLHPPANSDEQASNELLLRIFRLSIPAMPRTASTFANELTVKLKRMISKPSGGFSCVKETVGCYCAVVNYLTKEYGQLITILRACLGAVTRFRTSLAKSAMTGSARQQAVQALGLTLYIVALIAEHCNLDQLASEDDAIQADLSKFVKGSSLYEYLYDLFREFTDLPISQMAPILSLGCLFRAYPDLIALEETGEWMDKVFASNDADSHARLLGVMQDFLDAEARKKEAVVEGSKDITALIGNTAELSDAGVSTSMVQRNFNHIINGAKAQHLPTQTAALGVLAFTVNQSLYHPLQCLPILIALETSADPNLSDRALELHATMHQKHSNLVNVRFLDSAKASYEYQRSLSSEVSGHRDGVALLSGWFGLVGEKRTWRLELVRALGRAFEYDTAKTSEYDVGFALYVAENLATFEYRLQEEVMIAVQQLNTVVSTCTPLMQTLERAMFEREVENATLEGRMALIRPQEAAASEGEESTRDEVRAQPLIYASMVVCIALLIKNHLLSLYILSEDKCLKQTIGKKTAMGDRPAVRRGGVDVTLELERIPLVRGIETIKEFHEQQATFLQLLQEDGTMDLDD